MSINQSIRLTRYEICSQLGAGGMGEVYLAQDTKLNRKVAIKFLPPELITNDQANKRLLREARAAATLDHPNICAVHEVAEEDGRTFIVMQYIVGETLDARLKEKSARLKEGPARMKQEALELSESLSIAAQVADALAEAHSQGIVHRDIKPANIIITPRGQAKVMDFGLAKVVLETIESEAETQSLLTTPGVIVGTMPYMSPEQVRGETVDERTDIFSFGVVLYEMLTGHQPFAGGSGVATISAILTKEPPPLNSYLPNSQPELQQVVSKCLEKDRNQRYQTMRDVANDLERIRHERESGESFREQPSAARLAIESNQRTTFLRSRLGLAIASLVLLAAVATGYALFFKGRSGSETTASGKQVNPAAYDYYMRGRVLVDSENKEDNEAAVKLLEQAIEADPNFAPAFAVLATAYRKKAFFFAPGAERKQLNVDAEVAVEKALALDPDLAEAHYARGLILWTHAKRFPHEQAIQSYKRAIALNPMLDEAHHQLGVVYFHIGLLDKGKAECAKALELNPLNTLARFRLGVVDLYETKYEEALEIFKVIPRDANPVLFDYNLATALFHLGRFEEASVIIEKSLKSSATDEGGNVTSVKAMLLAQAGKEQEAEETIKRAAEIGRDFGHFHHTAYNIGVAYALLKKPAEAIKWLQVAAEDGFPCYPRFENDTNLDSLRQDERFVNFMAKLKQQWERYNAIF